jgi:hypothetical protein
MCAKSQVPQRDGYYKFKGWDNEGIPTKKTLKELDLGYVGEHLEQRGIITDGGRGDRIGINGGQMPAAEGYGRLSPNGGEGLKR